jgi:hypothetical protein
MYFLYQCSDMKTFVTLFWTSISNEQQGSNHNLWTKKGMPDCNKTDLCLASGRYGSEITRVQSVSTRRVVFRLRCELRIECTRSRNYSLANHFEFSLRTLMDIACISNPVYHKYCWHARTMFITTD